MPLDPGLPQSLSSYPVGAPHTYQNIAVIRTIRKTEALSSALTVVIGEKSYFSGPQSKSDASNEVSALSFSFSARSPRPFFHQPARSTELILSVLSACFQNDWINACLREELFSK